MNYLEGISLEELPDKSSYLAALPVVKQLYNAGQLRFSAPVTFFCGGERHRKIHPAGSHCGGHGL